MEKYNHQDIDKKWQSRWDEEKTYETSEDKSRPKYYVLDMFPYPSGTGLHVGHVKGYSATDILSRMKMMQGFNVLHPMGWDAFGLPAENYALENKVHPKVCTEKNIAYFKSQLKSLGFSYDWSREINTTDPEYYKWTQWAFIKMWEKGLVYESHEPIIWCPSCQTGLAMEDLEDGKCERCKSEIERKPMRQWVIKITDYADRLLNDIDKLTGWEDSIKEMQRNWIGRSEGAEINFSIICHPEGAKATEGSDSSMEATDPSRGAQDDKKGKVCNDKLTVFTTRPDTLFGCTYCVVAPEHPLVANYKLQITNYKEVEEYINNAKKKTDLQRTDLNKDKSGVKLEGIVAINPANGEEVPIFIADYVLANYGTGAIMAVPAHDERDFEFAKKYNLPIRTVVVSSCHPESRSLGMKDLSQSKKDEQSFSEKEVESAQDGDRSLAEAAREKVNCEAREAALGHDKDIKLFCEEGVNINSDFLNGLTTAEAKTKMIAHLEENNYGKKRVNYKLNDWVFSRQRYWGEPIPFVHCEKCGAVPVAEKDLPVRLPDVEHYEPTGTGESPLANIYEWVNTTCPKCGGPAKRETNTMPQWAGSSWYYLRYIDPKNNQALIDKDKEKYWSPVDFYVGGAEHATRHLIYARFWHKFLYDIGVVNYEEPFTRLQHVGLVMGSDGQKISKRLKNGANPMDVAAEFGADALRVYEMFMGPFASSCAWNTNGLVGARKFLDRIWNIANLSCHPESRSFGTKDLLQPKQDEQSFSEKEVESAQEKVNCEAREAALGHDKKIITRDDKKETARDDKGVKNLLHKTIKKVGEDIAEFKFNTCVSALMILVNAIEEQVISKDDFAKFIQILAPFAPHLAEEIWEKLGNKESIFKSAWPKYDPELLKEDMVNLIVQVNGKLRETIVIPAGLSNEEVQKILDQNEKVKKWTEKFSILKIIHIQARGDSGSRLVNIVLQ